MPMVWWIPKSSVCSNISPSSAIMVSFSVTSLFAALLAASTVAAQAPIWGQCGGQNWSGPTVCASGSRCIKLNDWHYQCIPEANIPTTTSSTTVIRPTSTSSTRASSTTVVTRTSTSAGSGPTSPPVTGSGPGSTLLKGFYWIRAVAPPNYHLYLQGETPRKWSLFYYIRIQLLIDSRCRGKCGPQVWYHSWPVQHHQWTARAAYIVHY